MYIINEFLPTAHSPPGLEWVGRYGSPNSGIVAGTRVSPWGRNKHLEMPREFVWCYEANPAISILLYTIYIIHGSLVRDSHHLEFFGFGDKVTEK